MKNIPAHQQEQIFNAIENNPELFKKIADEIQQKVKSGQDQQSATMQVITSYQKELSEVFNR